MVHASLLVAALVLPATATVTIDWTTVGDTGNPNDPLTGYGAVDHAYKIGKYEVTLGQYTEFLNNAAKSDPYGLYSSNMWRIHNIAGITRSGSDGDYTYSTIGSPNRPVASVSWFDAARMANWLHNGQGGGSTEMGVYNLNGATNGLGFAPALGAQVWIPSEDEWYKAAYYDPTKNDGTGGYWLQATQSDTLAGNTVGVADSANYYDGDYVGSGSSTFPMSGVLTEGGAYGVNSESYYGTNDQSGNVWEWNDVVTGSMRRLRGGSWDFEENTLASSYPVSGTPSGEFNFVGLRVASVPEPSALVMMMLASGLLLTRRKL